MAASANCSTAATRPVHSDSQKSSRSVDNTMNTKNSIGGQKPNTSCGGMCCAST
jgi:hypothetical protein